MKKDLNKRLRELRDRGDNNQNVNPLTVWISIILAIAVAVPFVNLGIRPSAEMWFNLKVLSVSFPLLIVLYIYINK